MSNVTDSSTLPVRWWKSTFSDSGNCVEFGVVNAQVAAIRDSKRPSGPALLAPVERFAALVDAVKRGDLA
ncbi:DUF397 domain-containing protein [Streptomyces sp. NPDC059740]|uniref:DUF397 domain-containing protein n=1 Tax=Streptomyces sp. NPDC059740 TaxID=3346926 RepID=UPI003654F869